MIPAAIQRIQHRLGPSTNLSEAKLTALLFADLVEHGVATNSLRLDMAHPAMPNAYPDLGFTHKGRQHWVEVKLFRPDYGATTRNGGALLKDIRRLQQFTDGQPDNSATLVHAYIGEPTQLITDSEFWIDAFIQEGQMTFNGRIDDFGVTVRRELGFFAWEGELSLTVTNTIVVEQGIFLCTTTLNS